MYFRKQLSLYLPPHILKREKKVCNQLEDSIGTTLRISRCNEVSPERDLFFPKSKFNPLRYNQYQFDPTTVP